ncbi:MAG: type II toxin-antitoxin system RelB/DinJ family antitoxin [Kiritimatiellae bacterium]|nr:type II toxin-antitoxin system RelB/DinJ family antitoxin [Kiritimatiellia bacterium]
MTTSLTIRMDETLKADAEEFFEDIGMNLTTAITCFFKKCLATGEIPFTLSRSTHDRLVAALREADAVAADPDAATCTDPGKLSEFLRP